MTNKDKKKDSENLEKDFAHANISWEKKANAKHGSKYWKIKVLSFNHLS